MLSRIAPHTTTPDDLRTPAWVAANRTGELAPEQWQSLIEFHARHGARREALLAALILLGGTLWVATCVSVMHDQLNDLTQQAIIAPGFGLLALGLFFVQRAYAKYKFRRTLEADIAEHTVAHELCQLTPTSPPTLRVTGKPLVFSHAASNLIPGGVYRVYYLERSHWVLSLEVLPSWSAAHALPAPPPTPAEARIEQQRLHADRYNAFLRQQSLTRAACVANRAGHSTARQRFSEGSYILFEIILFELVVGLMSTCALITNLEMSPPALRWAFAPPLIGQLVILAFYAPRIFEVFTGTLRTASGSLDDATIAYIRLRPEQRVSFTLRSGPRAPIPPPAKLALGGVKLRGLSFAQCQLVKSLQSEDLRFTVYYWPFTKRIVALELDAWQSPPER